MIKFLWVPVVLFGAWAGYEMGRQLPEWLQSFGLWWNQLFVGGTVWYVMLGALLSGLTLMWCSQPLTRWWRGWRDDVRQLSLFDTLATLFGLCSGIVLAQWIAGVFAGKMWLPWPLAVILHVVLAAVGGVTFFKHRVELQLLFRRPSSAPTREIETMSHQLEAQLDAKVKILDTSVIIDGRIADLCKTGFVEGNIIVPVFVLEELQHIADSADLLKRNRGRRGLDILNKMQKELVNAVIIDDQRFEDTLEVDSKLIKLAKQMNGHVVTNDFNLNKVCELQGVDVLNINDLANAIKPVVLPGEEMLVTILKDGKEQGQGVAYLDDGTMIVVEGGREHIGTSLQVIVTSVLQTSAGRMIFARPKLLEKAL